MMKKNKLLKTLLLLTAMLVGSATNVLGQTTLFLWQSDGSTTTLEASLPATGGTAAFYGTASPGTESAAYNEAVTDNDLKATGTKGHKLGTNTLYLKITLTGGNKLQAGDIIYICGYKPFRVGTGVTSDRANTDLASNLATGTSKTDYNVGSVTVPSTIGNNVTEIYLSRAESTGTGLAAVKIVRPAVTTDPVITASDASITATKSGVAVTKDVVVTGANLTGSTLTATLSPAVEGLSVSLASNTITDGAISTTATLSYTATENASGTTTLTLSDGTTSKEVTITYTAKVVATELQTISEETEWDFSSNAITGNVQFSNDDLTTEYVYADIHGLTFTSDFNSEAIAFKGEYPLRDSKYAQNGELHFKVSGSGTIVVKFTDTGTSSSNSSSSAYKRYLSINGTKTEYWTSREYTGDGAYAAQLDITTDEISVDAGDIIIKGVKEDGTSIAAIRVSYIKFTPAATTVAVTGVTVDGTAEVEVGKTVTLTATVAPENATNKNVTWESDNTKVAIVDADGVVTGVAEGTANITVTTVDDNKTATCVVTVVAATPSTGGTAQFKFTAKADWNSSNWQTVDPIKATFTNKAESDYVKFAKGNTLTLEVVDDSYAITNVKLGYVDGNAPKNETITTTVGTMNIAGTEWNGVASELVITNSATSSNDARVNMLEVTYVQAIKTTIGSTGWSTFCSDKALDFTGLDVKAYMVTGVNGTKVEKLAVNETVPANTPLLLNGVAAAAYSIPVVESSETSTADNKLVAGTGEVVSAEPGFAKYVMVASEGKAVFKKIVRVSATVPVGKAYLKISEEEGTAPMFSIDGDDDTTGINSVERGALSVEGCYTLDGRRVENPTKGLYIVNGKKVIIK